MTAHSYSNDPSDHDLASAWKPLEDGLFEDSRGEQTYVHPSSYVDAPCKIGNHTSILHFSHIMSHAIIGEHSHVGHNVTIGSGVIIGNHVRVMNNSLLNSGVILEDEVYCGASTIFNPLSRMKGTPKLLSRVSPTLVKRGTTIGANTVIAAGITIGAHAFVEPTTVIDGSIPDFALVLGNPMRLVGWRCECGEPLDFKKRDTIECDPCGRQYFKESPTRINAVISSRTPTTPRSSEHKYRA